MLKNKTLSSNSPGDFVHGCDDIIRQSASIVGTKVQQEIRLARHAVTVGLGDDVRALQFKVFVPEPSVHAWHGRINWSDGQPGFHRQIVFLTFKHDLRIMALGRR